VIVPFNRKVKQADPTLEPTLQGPELSGILNWALQGLQAYWADKEAGLNPLPLPSAAVRRVAEHSLETNPARQFLLFEVTKVEGASITAEELQAAYVQWCKANGIPARKLLDASGLGREVKRHLGLTSTIRRFGAVTKRVYEGIDCPRANDWPPE
jgi:phage/plasmid-associated DNA primase